MGKNKWDGVWPVMLTPFTDNGEVDYLSLGRLIEWYEERGVDGMFCLCQSSEIFYLTLNERLQIAEFVKKHAHVPVIASGHTAYAISEQADELARIAQTGVDGLVMISNRFAPEGASVAQWQENLSRLLTCLPTSMAWGIYECPHPYKRLLQESDLTLLREQPQMRFIKDTCCDIELIRQRLAVLGDSQLHLYNANTRTLLDSLRAGAAGFSGVMANFHPELYVWLCNNYDKEPELAEEVQSLLTVGEMAEGCCYPVCAKQYLVEEGVFASNYTRTCSAHTLTEADMGHIRSIHALVEKQKIALSLSV